MPKITLEYTDDERDKAESALNAWKLESTLIEALDAIRYHKKHGNEADANKVLDNVQQILLDHD